MRSIAKKIRSIFNKIVTWFQSLITSASRGYRSSTMAAFAGFSAIPLAAFAAIILVNDLFVRIPCILFIGFFMWFWMRSYEYTLRRMPDNLRSEKFILENKKIELMASKGEEPRLPRSDDAIGGRIDG